MSEKQQVQYDDGSYARSYEVHETRDQIEITAEQIVFNVLASLEYGMGVDKICQSLRDSGLLVEGAPTDEQITAALKSYGYRGHLIEDPAVRNQMRAALAAAGVAPPSPQCDDDGCLHYDHSPEQGDPMDEDLTVYWVCGECGAKESVRGAAMATGPKHTCEGPEPTPSDDLSEALRDPHADPDATPMSGEAAVQYRPAPSEPARHEFLPVNGHPDDDECTYRDDGTDATYCGEPRESHNADYQEWLEGERSVSEAMHYVSNPGSEDHAATVTVEAKRYRATVAKYVREYAQALYTMEETLSRFDALAAPAPLDEAKIAEVLHEVDCNAYRGQPHQPFEDAHWRDQRRHLKSARGVCKYLKGER